MVIKSWHQDNNQVKSVLQLTTQQLVSFLVYLLTHKLPLHPSTSSYTVSAVKEKNIYVSSHMMVNVYKETAPHISADRIFVIVSVMNLNFRTA